MGRSVWTSIESGLVSTARCKLTTLNQTVKPAYEYSILTRPKDIEMVFRDSHMHVKASANDRGDYMLQLLSVCLGLISGTDWRTLRKATEAPCSRTATGTYMDVVLDHAKIHVSSLAETKPERWKCIRMGTYVPTRSSHSRMCSMVP
jgi:cytochrome P450